VIPKLYDFSGTSFIKVFFEMTSVGLILSHDFSAHGAISRHAVHGHFGMTHSQL